MKVLTIRNAVIAGAIAIAAAIVPAMSASATGNTYTPYCSNIIITAKNTNNFDSLSYPSTASYCLVQYGIASDAGDGANELVYNGPVDGALGVNSWKSIPASMHHWAGCTGPIDGVPGTNTYKAMQRYAQLYGYTGPVDGVLGSHSWRYFTERIAKEYIW